ncbi:type VI secretion system domain-containing protein [candidate division CSSED10-310 bacterium]|uniref:Type VI secretion system domain-containing protein n=1 Tax=candidate division CSSED10-310 bacterium TaxID=2855610 RepID=A0ABV6Z1X2_UNCC1
MAALIAELKAKIGTMIKEKKLPQALMILKNQVIAARSVREQFMWQIELCRVFVKTKTAPLAATYLENILETIAEYQLERWEPDLALEGLTICLKALRLQPDPKDEELLKTLEKKIALLNPAQALSLL